MDKSDPFWMKTIFIMLPAVIAPLLAWLASLRATSRRSSELDFLLRRIELVERVQKVQGGTEVANRPALDAELRDIVSDLTDLRVGVLTLHPSATLPNRNRLGAGGFWRTSSPRERDRRTRRSFTYSSRSSHSVQPEWFRQDWTGALLRPALVSRLCTESSAWRSICSSGSRSGMPRFGSTTEAPKSDRRKFRRRRACSMYSGWSNDGFTKRHPGLTSPVGARQFPAV